MDTATSCLFRKRSGIFRRAVAVIILFENWICIRLARYVSFTNEEITSNQESRCMMGRIKTFKRVYFTIGLWLQGLLIQMQHLYAMSDLAQFPPIQRAALSHRRVSNATRRIADCSATEIGITNKTAPIWSLGNPITAFPFLGSPCGNVLARNPEA